MAHYPISCCAPSAAPTQLASKVCRCMQHADDLVLECVGGGSHGVVSQVGKAPPICRQAGRSSSTGRMLAAVAGTRQASRAGACQGHCSMTHICRQLTLLKEALVVEDGQAIGHQERALPVGEGQGLRAFKRSRRRHRRRRQRRRQQGTQRSLRPLAAGQGTCRSVQSVIWVACVRLSAGGAVR